MRIWRRVTATLVASVLLAGCTSSTPLPTINAHPSVDIGIGLNAVACQPGTSLDVCEAYGTTLSPSGAFLSQSQVGHDTTWRANTSALHLTFSPVASSCSATTCLFGGQANGQDALVAFSPATETSTPIAPPTGGIGLVALNCSASSCAAVDYDATNSAPRLLTSNDGGITWSTPIDITGVPAAVVTGVACNGLGSCVIGFGADPHTTLWTTHDGGNTWKQLPTTVRLVNSFSCTSTQCWADFHGSSQSWVRTIIGPSQSINLGNVATSGLSCTPSRCVVIEASGSQQRLVVLSHLSARHVLRHVFNVRYLASPLLSLSCGARSCVAVSATSTVTIKP